ncbi:prepilin peptidase [Zavarzinia compransoris]|uniref:prepilin peptidase n=1 Tax=Zavarzinia marina TaxID=2911065 RepID=UPI001F25C8D8|nr:prepilin peptidase [Zavarzinia marina]MCF4166049.1 prepilin peptidase [Zavarzinia marina]
MDMAVAAPAAGVVLGLLAGHVALRVNRLLAAHRALAVPGLGWLWWGLSGLYGGLALWRFGISPHGALLAVLGAIAFATAAFDFAHRRIPNDWSLAVAALGLLDAALSGRVVEALAAGIGGAALLWAFGRLYGMIRGRDGLGLGDVKLVVGLGFWLGPIALIWCFMAASLVTAILGAAALVMRRLSDDPPFGPGLLAAALALAIAGPPPY